MSDGRTFKFIAPPECPVFEPTVDEFEDAFKYIEKIKSVGEKYGLCKIRPPSSWKPPFMVDHSSFKFTPRIQKLNEIEATSRVRVMFVLNLSKFWQLQGFDLKTPTICGKPLDFFRLKKAVENEGGFENVCSRKLWTKISKSLQLTGSKVPSQLRNHYEKILYPYDVFLSGLHGQEQMNSIKVKKDVVDVVVKKENVENEIKVEDVNKNRKKSRGKHIKMDVKSHVRHEDEYICRYCGRGDNDEVLLLCDGCDGACHTFCLIPPLSSVPKGDWRCPSCVAQECSKPSEAYGFEQSEKEYTLESFTKMANEFKEKYFSVDPKSVPCGRVEEEFWRILSGDDDVVVQYGADNPAGTCGSGFPTMKNFNKGDEKYVHSSWNLNNLSVLPSSVLRFIEDEVSGMKVPWCYVGMAFSCFSWHTEDHWSYSVNYMHWGEPKTWYGVPGSAAEKLEECMIQNVPELFQHSPDLMHQLTTLLNPNLLMNSGVPITRTDQHAGEFIITFPRAYHAGFNQGINFAEAVNYCPPDWIQFGRGSVLNYKTVHRQCVFSLDELFVSVSHHGELDVDLVEILHSDLEAAFHHELQLVNALRQQGLCAKRQEVFEKLSDDERQCHTCCTTCFLFSVICSCQESTGFMSCLEHSVQLCKCPLMNKMILYRFNDEELENILSSLKRRRDRWKEWLRETEQVILRISRKTFKPELAHVRELVMWSKNESYPQCESLRILLEIIRRTEEFLNGLKQTFAPSLQVKTRNKSCTSRLPTITNLEMILSNMEHVECKLTPEREMIMTLLQGAYSLKARIKAELLDSNVPPSASLLQQLTEAISATCVHMDETDVLAKVRDELQWFNSTAFWTQTDTSDELRAIEELEALIASGEKMSSICPWFLERLETVRSVMKASLEFMEKASVLIGKVTKALVDRSDEVNVEELENLVADSKMLKMRVENVDRIKNICSKVDEWKIKIQALLDRHHKMHMEELEEVLERTRTLPVNLGVLDRLKVMWQQGCKWRNDLKGVVGHMRQTSHSLMTKLFHHAPATALFQEVSATCDMSSHFQQCKAECSSAIENIRKYNERCHITRQQVIDCQRCGVDLGLKFHRCPVCRAPLHEKCLVEYYVSNLISSGCPSCQINKGNAALKSLKTLAEDYRLLNICMWDGEVLLLLVDYANSWQELVVSEIEVSELKQFCQILVSKNRLLPRNHPTSLALDESPLPGSAFPSIRFPKATLERLIGLLLSGHVLDIDLDLCNVLSCLIHSCQIPSMRNEVKAGGERTRGSPKSVLTSIYKVVAKSSNGTSLPAISKSRSNRKIKRKMTSCDECSCLPCKKPKGRKVNWVQCDKCDLWYHLICLNMTLENLEEDLDYVCPACSLEVNETVGSFMTNMPS